MELILLTLFRLLVPLTILRYPLIGFSLSIMADIIDWFLFPFTGEASYAYYQRWDKFLDIYFLGAALYTAVHLKDKLVAKILVALFLLRLTGVIFFELTGAREFLFFFPNIFLGYFMFILLLQTFNKKINKSTFRDNLIILLIVSTPIMIAEYFHHFIKKLPWEFGWGRIINTSSELTTTMSAQLMFVAIFALPPVLLLGWRLLKRSED